MRVFANVCRVWALHVVIGTSVFPLTRRAHTSNLLSRAVAGWV
jgi:hypothetical protein